MLVIGNWAKTIKISTCLYKKITITLLEVSTNVSFNSINKKGKRKSSSGKAPWKQKWVISSDSIFSLLFNIWKDRLGEDFWSLEDRK